MFLEYFKKLKGDLNESELFETLSFMDNPLFSNKKLLKEDFDNFIDVENVKAFNNEIELTISKLAFIKGFLGYYKQMLEEESKLLDSEISSVNNTTSFKGSSFLELKDRMLDYNYVFETELVHSKNIQKSGSIYYKVEENSEKVNGYFSYPDVDKITFNIKEPSNINEIIVETHKEIVFSIYGETEKGETKPLFLNVSSSQKLFINTLEDKYRRIIFIANSNMKSYIKNLVIYKKENSSAAIEKNGFVFFKVKNKNIKNILVSSDNDTEIFALNKSEFEISIKEIHNNEKYVVDKFLIEKNKVEKNKQILFDSIINEFYFVEVIGKKVNHINETKIFGKE